jgi:hypothetical protein
LLGNNFFCFPIPPVSPYLNRFIQPDTIVPGLFHPQNLNRYSYVLNNPVNLVDPSGHRSCSTRQANTGDETCWQNIWIEYKNEKQRELDNYTGYSDDKDEERQIFAPDILGETVTPESEKQLWQFIKAGDLAVNSIIENDLGAGCSCNDLASSVLGVKDTNDNGLIDFVEYASMLDYSHSISQYTVLVLFTKEKDETKTPLHAALMVSVDHAYPEDSILI